MAENKKDAAADAEATEKKPTRKPAAKAETAAAEKPAKATKAKADAPKAETKAAADKPAKAAKADAPKAETKAAADKPAAKATKAAAKADAPKASTPAEGLGGTLRVHHLRPAPGAHTPKTRVGRGEGSKGKTAGRGTKGTKARYQVPERREGGGIPLHMRQPKLRGFKNPFKTTYQVVNLDRLAELYPAGGSVTAEDLVAKGAVRKGQPVKVLGVGDVAVKLDVSVTAVSATAREKILAAGGSVQD
ncbi:50S ribosomal protein L15 [Actinotalea fermentans]|nr:50S ribosomal protein L15 [Actinotalea fermentans]